MPNSAVNIIKKVASLERPVDENVEESVQLIVFELDKEEYAVAITDIQEIKRIPEVTPIPNSPPFIKGIFNLRGKIIVVVDLERRFNLIRDHQLSADDGNIIITEVNENNYGVIVDKVTEIINVGRSKIQPAPALVSTKIHADYLKGVVVLEEGGEEDRNHRNESEEMSSRLIILLDLPKMLQEKELLSFGQAVQETLAAN